MIISKEDNYIVYHAGDFSHKSEDLFQLSPSRGTGYFGTGYYFCTKPEKAAVQGKDRPIYSLDVSGLDLFIGTIYNHEKLRTINKIVSWWPWMSVDMSTWWDLIHSINSFYSSWARNEIKLGTYIQQWWNEEHEEHPDLYPTFTEYFGKDYNEKLFIESCEKIPELKEIAVELKTDNPDFNKIDDIYENSYYFDESWYDDIKEVSREIKYVYSGFCKSEEHFRAICEKIYNQLENYYENGVLRTYNTREEDSIPTRFLRLLGYQGVYPSRECDNTTYGGVLFEKPENTEFVGNANEFLTD